MTVLGSLKEVRSVRAPLGVRLLDPRDDRPVRSLQVSAHDLAGALPATHARVTVGGVHAFDRVPGVPPLVDGADAPTIQVAVSIADPADRYVPATYVVDAPVRAVPARPSDGLGLYVFPGPGAAGRSGFAAVRADLVDDDAPTEAAGHAVLTVDAGAGPGVGIAGQDGRAVAYVPLPPPPPNGGPRPTWSLAVSVRWAPAQQERVPGLSVPTVTSLFAQDAAQVVDLVDPELRAGDEPALSSVGGPRLRVRRD